MSSTPHFTSSANPTLPGSSPYASPTADPFLSTDWTIEDAAAMYPAATANISTYRGSTAVKPDAAQYRFKKTDSETWSTWRSFPAFNSLPYSGPVSVTEVGVWNVQIKAIVNGVESTPSDTKTVTVTVIEE